jgi:peroxiredoxin family protein
LLWFHPMTRRPDALALLLHSGDYAVMHQAFSIAAAGAASGRTVDLFFFWWALERLIRDDLDAPKLGPGREALEEDFTERGFPTLRQLLEAARATGKVKLFACSGSLAILGHTAQSIQGKVDELVGWATILDRTAGVTDRFFL